MRLLSCEFRGVRWIGVAEDETVTLYRPRDVTLVDIATNPALLEGLTRDATVPAEDVVFLQPVLAPAKIICVGVNYAAHAAEAARTEPPAYPSLFIRFADSLVAHGQAIRLPEISEQFDFEGELAVVIGSRAWRVTREEALRHVAGYSCFTENSVRDFQRHAAQVTAGKNFYASGAFGPYLTTEDAVGVLNQRQLTTRLNGEIMQQATLGEMIFPVDALISYISQFTPLAPGDVIATGTPAGVGALRKPPVWMRAGDRLELEIEGVGLLRNEVAPE